MRPSHVILLLLLCALNAYADEEPPDKNAAEYYTKAFEALQLPESEQTMGPATMIMMQGWANHGTPELERFIDRNEECLELFAKGVAVENCDFTFGEPKVMLFSGTSRWNRSVWNMTRLVVLAARRAEHRGDMEKAVEMYLAHLKFMDHVAQGRPTIDKIIALNCEGRTLLAIIDCLKKFELDKDSFKKLAMGLKAHEKRFYPVQRILDDEKDYYLFIVQWVVDRALEVKPEDGEDNSGTIKYGKALLEEAGRCSGEFYELGRKGCASDTKEGWAPVQAKEQELRKKGGTIRNGIRKVEDFVDLVRTEKYTAPELAEMMLGLYLSSPKGMMQSHTNNLKRLRQALERMGVQ
jgi:hypothetical protein